MTDTLNEKQERTFSLIIILVLLAYFAVFAIVNFAGFAYFCNADMYEDTLVARLMWEQKTLFPANYIFGNQYYVIATPVFAALFYGRTGSMNVRVPTPWMRPWLCHTPSESYCTSTSMYASRARLMRMLNRLTYFCSTVL